MTERINITPQSAFEDGRMQGAKDFFFSATTNPADSAATGKFIAGTNSASIKKLLAMDTGRVDDYQSRSTISVDQAEKQAVSQFAKGDPVGAILTIDQAADAGDSHGRAVLRKHQQTIMDELQSAMKKGETDLSGKIAAILPTLTSSTGPKHEGLVKTKVDLVKNLVVGCAADINLKVRKYEEAIREQTRDMIKNVKVGRDLLTGANMLNRDAKSAIGSQAMAKLLEKTMPQLTTLITPPNDQNPETFLSLVFSQMLKGYFVEVLDHLNGGFINAAIAVDECLGNELRDVVDNAGKGSAMKGLKQLVEEVTPVTKEDETNINEVIGALTQLSNAASGSTAIATILNRLTDDSGTSATLSEKLLQNTLAG